MKLIIVESPAKAKTIKTFLPKEYEVIASKGHIRDLPKNRFGIKIENDTLAPEYRVSEDSTATVKQIQELAKKSDTIYIATDEDREGEAIGWHIAHAIGKEPATLPRIVFHEITKNAILHALETPRTIDMDRVNAQQARRLLDRIVGYKLSPLLGSKIQKGLSAGRVQSSTLKIIVDREREIQAFIPVEYWSLDTLFEGGIEATITMYEGTKIEKLSISHAEVAHAMAERIRMDSFRVAAIETKERKSSTPPPFMTSTLQQSASSQLGFSPKKTMMIAQSLYEGVKTPHGTSGVITYMRTDSLNLATEAVDEARRVIEERFGSAYLPKEPKVYVKKTKGAQEAHEAIRPTMIDFTPEIASTYLKPDEIKLYRLIYHRFVASQMEDARFEQQSITFEGDHATFRATGRKLLFDGFYRVMGSEDKDRLLPSLTLDQSIAIEKLSPTQHFTEAPSRYLEASLIKKLESEGIGRPSTYAPTISTLQAREYITIEKRQITPTPIAFTVTELLEKHFEEIVDVSFTATMEERLDAISEKGESWQAILLAFYHPFIAKVDAGKKSIASLKMAQPLGRMCPQCGSELLLRSGRFGEFIACSGYPKCKYTEQTSPQEAPKNSDEVCEKCGSAMVIKRGRNGEFLACSAYPECKNTKPLTPKEIKVSTIACPECGGQLVWRQSRRGAFWGCEHYPKCTFISKFEPTTRRCECGGVLVARTYRNKEVYECLKCKQRTPMEEHP